jgi:putative transposase
MNDVDVVTRLHQKRKYDFRLGEQVGNGDHIVEWTKPARPTWMDEEMYAMLPATLRMREIRYTVNQPGYRVHELVVATTLLDTQAYPAAAVAELYGKRWTVELDIRALKVTLKMDCLRCKTPQMVEKEIWAHLLAYNLVRKVGAQVAMLMEVTPRSISFTAAKQAILGGWQQATQLQGVEYVRVAKAMLKMLGKEVVGNRPGRCEPRAVKRRPKAHKLLTEPRQEARAKLLQDRPKKEEAKPKHG